MDRGRGRRPIVGDERAGARATGAARAASAAASLFGDAVGRREDLLEEGLVGAVGKSALFLEQPKEALGEEAAPFEEGAAAASRRVARGERERRGDALADALALELVGGSEDDHLVEEGLGWAVWAVGVGG